MSKTIDLAAMKFTSRMKHLRQASPHTVRTSMERAKQLYDQAIILEAWQNYDEALNCAREALRELNGADAVDETSAVRLMIAALESKITRESADRTDHSYRSARIGSIRLARNAGT